MKSTDIPSKMPVPFATNGQRTDIISATISGSNKASYSDGFPAITMIDESAGGAPPLGQNVNQILFELASAMRWDNAGGIYSYDSDFSTSVGGYPKGSRLLSTDGVSIWISTVDDNETDPDSTSASGWVKSEYYSTGRYLSTKVFTSSGTYIPSSGCRTINIIVCGGGGSGGGCAGSSLQQTISGGGGGAGGTGIKKLLISSLSSYTVTVGSGGSKVSGAVAGMNGSSSSFGGVTANGGAGAGYGGVTYCPGGLGGTSSGGDINITGGDGSDGQYGQLFMAGNGGDSYFGGGGRAGSASGMQGRSYGSGGGGAYDGSFSGTQYSSGQGSSGVVIIQEYS